MTKIIKFSIDFTNPAWVEFFDNIEAKAQKEAQLKILQKRVYLGQLTIEQFAAECNKLGYRFIWPAKPGNKKIVIEND